MNITILSGGSGNDALVRGLKKFSSDVNIKVITNAYDSGKSTGICRKVTNTLGVSDIRKNHSRMYEAMTKVPDKRLLEFYNSRYDMGDYESAHKYVNTMLTNWGLKDLCKFSDSFFERAEAKKYEYKDFSIANIVYAEMYARIGYEETNKFFCDLLGLDDFVLLNSFDNVYLKANTRSGHVIEDEGDLVAFANPNDVITDIFYEPDIKQTLNKKAIEAVLNCDLLVISTGTFWSSIFPTLDYNDFYKWVNKSTAKKVWAIDNIEDKDAYGVSSNDFIRIVQDRGLNLDDFTILENLDAVEILRQPNDEHHIVYKHMENNNGKHNGIKYAKALLSIYYGVESVDLYDKIIFDFDDTLWARDYNKNEKNRVLSIENMNLVNELHNSMIISGNTFSSMTPKLFQAFGTNLSNLSLDIWADANAVLYKNGKQCDKIDSLLISKKSAQLVRSILAKYDVNCEFSDEDNIFNIKIKPLSELERKLLVDFLNTKLFNDNNCFECLAKPTGLTTVDIVNKLSSKSVVFDYCNFGDKKTLYIGDEIDNGNDHDIAKMCTTSIHTSGVEETNMLLKLMLED